MKFSKVNGEVISLVILIILAFFLRSYGLYRDLVFAYDQGRDAFAAQKILGGDLTLIGPTTGLTGVFLGPFWFYLIAPLYFLSQGSPMLPAYAMIFFHTATVVLLYFFAWRIGGKVAGWTAAILFTFSFSNILFARWLSNPTPLPFFATLTFLTLWLAIEKRLWTYFALTGILIGICLQLEAANAIWFIPAVALIVAIETFGTKGKLAKNFWLFVRTGLIVAAGFLLTTLPQIFFEIKNNFLITKNLITAFQVTHEVTILGNLSKRLTLLYQLYGRGLFLERQWLLGFTLVLFVFVLIWYRSVFFSNRGWRIAAIWFLVPLFFHTIYTGNHGNFWDYYILAQHGALYLLLAATIGILASQAKIKDLVMYFGIGLVVTSVFLNFSKWTEIIEPYKERYALSMQVEEARWMIDESEGRKYGAWVYAPNYQDDPHRYVFWWIGRQRGVFPEEHVERQPIIYLVVEDDPIHAKRRAEWIAEKSEFGTIIASKKFGAIQVFKLENTTSLRAK